MTAAGLVALIVLGTGAIGGLLGYLVGRSRGSWDA